MPTSDTAQISTIIDLIQIIKPTSILDIGCGWGKYGFLTREYLMGIYWDKNQILVDAVEGYEKNITQLQREIYNNIFLCDALDFGTYLKQNYDVIMLIDIFEHLPKNDGIRIIENLRKNCRYLLISIPRYVSVQKGYTDDLNKFEEHRAFWTRKMFKDRGSCVIIPNNARKTIALFTGERDLTKEIKKYIRERFVSKFLPYFVKDSYNYIKWLLNRNNPELFLKK